MTESGVRLVAEAVNSAHAVDEATLDVMDPAAWTQARHLSKDR